MSDAKEILIEKMTENLPVLRKKLRLSQEGLADIIGTSRHTVMLMETGKRKMTWNTFLSLMLLFGKNEETFVLMKALEIDTEEFEAMITVRPDNAR